MAVRERLDGSGEGTCSDVALMKAKAIEARERLLTVTAAAAAVGVHRMTLLRWAKADPEFAEALRDAGRGAVERLEESVYERAFKEPLLAMFVVKAHKPEYNDRVQAARAFVEAQADSPAARLAAKLSDLLTRLEPEARHRVVEGEAEEVWRLPAVIG